ncbi:MAG: hypothetical protein IH914_03550 [candidate division Zixibacteria bacterium]|nr:hypothetical protein [candidate division Zixibacteria bacterium]
MTWHEWIAVSCALLVSVWFVTDGTVALVSGDYVTPKSGQYAGQLGPWAKLVSRVGIDPRSTAMKLIFVVYGLIWLAVIVVFVLHANWSWWAMLVAAALSLWYLPFGTVLGVIQIALLLIARSGRG